MGSSINIQVTGYVGSEPQIKDVGEQKVASFSLAVNRKTRNGTQQTLWVRVNCWNGLASVVENYLTKGKLVQISTSWMRPSAWIDQNGTPRISIDLDANRLILLDRAEQDHEITEIPI